MKYSENLMLRELTGGHIGSATININIYYLSQYIIINMNILYIYYIQ